MTCEYNEALKTYIDIQISKDRNALIINYNEFVHMYTTELNFIQ